MNIRFFNTYEPVVSLYRDLVPYLHEQGAKIDIVVSKGEYRRGRQRLKHAFAHLSRVRVIETANFGFHAYDGTLAKAIVTLSYMIWTTLYTLFGPRIDKNVFLTQPPFIPLLGYLLFLLRRQPYYCIVMDIQPQMAVSLGLANGNRLLTKLLTKLSNLSLRKSQGVIVIGRCMAEKVMALGVPTEKIHFIPNWANEEAIYPVANEENLVRLANEWRDTFVVLYAGNIGIPQYFDDLLTVATKLTSYEDIRIVFIGEGARRQVIDEWVQKHHLSNVICLPFLHEKYPLAHILSAGDVHFVTLRDVCTGLAVPSKSYGIITAGRPLIYQGDESGEIARIVVEEKIGIFVATGDAASLESAILDYYHRRAKLKADGEKARQLATSRYSRQRGIIRYANLLLEE